MRRRPYVQAQGNTMAKQVVTAEATPSFVQRVQNFFEDIINELKKVTWPTKEDLMASTKVTLFMLLVMGVVIFFLDRIFAFLVMLILNFVS